MLVTPARFERATFPLGGGRLAHTQQGIRLILCQTCAKFNYMVGCLG